MRFFSRAALWLPLGVAAVAAVGYLALEVVFDLVPDRYAGRGQSRSDVSTLAVQLLGGLVLAVGALFTARTYWLNRGGQMAERYATAIGQLASEKREVRLGGVYALERIARDSRYDHVRVVEVLTAYLRDRAAWREESYAADSDKAAADAVPGPQREWDERRPGRAPTVVQAVIAVLGRRKAHHDEHKLDLSATDLRDVKFGEGNFSRALLQGANLEGAHLDDAHLEGAKYDATTKWPMGLDVTAAGAVRDEPSE